MGRTSVGCAVQQSFAIVSVGAGTRRKDARFETPGLCLACEGFNTGTALNRMRLAAAVLTADCRGGSILHP